MHIEFEKINWRLAYKWLDIQQTELIKVYKENNIDKTRKIQISILKDYRTTAIAVKKVFSNKGSNTAGVDGKTLKTDNDIKNAMAKAWHTIKNPNTYEPELIRRVWIPKKNGKMRPLGIPTIHDRIIQSIYKEIIDPICEVNSCENSYGFRKYRSAKDAVLSLRGKLIHPKASEWVYNADISKCFDKIDHNFLLRQIPVYRKVDRKIMKLMLKAGIMDNGQVIKPIEGTPQGGTLSPVLANIALNGLEKTVKIKAKEIAKNMKIGRNPKVHVVRYADDFVVIAPYKKMFKFLIPTINEFLLERGLEISKEKTTLENIRTTRIEFLGFNYQKQAFNYRKRYEIAWDKRKTKSTSRINILPSESNIIEFKNKTKDILDKYVDISTIIITLNPYIRGWANYFNATSTSAEYVRKLHRYVLRLCWNKVNKLYPKLTRKQIKSQYFPKYRFYQNGRFVKRAWVFSANTKLERPSDAEAKIRLYNLDSVKAPGIAMVKTGLNAYLPEDKIQLKKNTSFSSSSTIEKLARKQKYLCAICEEILEDGVTIELHHEPSLKDWQTKKKQQARLVVLHTICHRMQHKLNQLEQTL